MSVNKLRNHDVMGGARRFARTPLPYYSRFPALLFPGFSSSGLGLNVAPVPLDSHLLAADPALCQLASVFFGHLFTTPNGFLTFCTFD